MNELRLFNNDLIGKNMTAGSADDSALITMKNFQMMTLPKDINQGENNVLQVT
jgi:hypothetical protein